MRRVRLRDKKDGPLFVSPAEDIRRIRAVLKVAPRHLYRRMVFGYGLMFAVMLYLTARILFFRDFASVSISFLLITASVAGIVASFAYREATGMRKLREMLKGL